MHDLTFDHQHATEEEKVRLSETIWNADNVELTTVGVDIGSSTSHCMFAKVHMQRLSQALSSRFVVVNRQVLWSSPIMLTPYLTDNTIDAGKLGDFIHQAYADAGLDRSAVDSGAVILTGEALKRHNARAIADLFAEESGKFVCASAGHHLECAMAAHGSGAVELSRKEDRIFLNVDIGGGTCKLALVSRGKVLATSAVAVGGRLIAMGADGELVRIEGPALQTAQAAGVELKLGAVLTKEERGNLVRTMADALISHILQEEPVGLARDLMVTERLDPSIKPDAILFSGGVSEFIFKRAEGDVGDIGGNLAHVLVHAINDQRIPYPVIDYGQGIRATVIGASQFSVQVSGNTIHVSKPESLPLRNLPVLRPALSLEGDFSGGAVTEEIQKALKRFDLEDGEGAVALAFRWEGDPLHARLRALCDGIAAGLPRTIADSRTLVLLFDGDVGNTVGQIFLKEIAIPGDVVSIDGVQLQEFDYVDIGEIIPASNVVPVIIKSLLFSASDWHG